MSKGGTSGRLRAPLTPRKPTLRQHHIRVRDIANPQEAAGPRRLLDTAVERENRRRLDNAPEISSQHRSASAVAREVNVEMQREPREE